MLAELALGIGDIGTITVIIGAFTAIQYSATKSTLKGFSDRVQAIERRLQKVSDGKADKHAWVRETIKTRENIQELGMKIEHLSASIETNFGVAASVNRLTDEVKKQRGTGN